MSFLAKLGKPTLTKSKESDSFPVVPGPNKKNSTKDSVKNAANSTLSSVKANYQDWLKYGVFFFLMAYVLIIVVGLFGLPPDTLHNMFSFINRFFDYFRLDYTSIGKPPQSDNEVEGIQMYQR